MHACFVQFQYEWLEDASLDVLLKWFYRPVSLVIWLCLLRLHAIWLELYILSTNQMLIDEVKFSVLCWLQLCLVDVSWSQCTRHSIIRFLVSCWCPPTTLRFTIDLFCIDSHHYNPFMEAVSQTCYCLIEVHIHSTIYLAHFKPESIEVFQTRIWVSP